MANPLYMKEREIARLEGYVPMNLHDRGDLCYVLKKHNPPENRHASGRSQDEIKKDVLTSSRMQQVILEVQQIRWCRSVLLLLSIVVDF